MATAKRLTYAWGLGLPGGIGGLLDLYQGAVHFSYMYDGKGNVTGLLDENANVAATYAYGPFGEPRVPANSLSQPMQFSTKPYDEKTGLSYYGYRYYVPALGRWLTRDPIGEAGGINLYGFVDSVGKLPIVETNLYSFTDNNPVNLIDPDGMAAIAPIPPGYVFNIPFIPYVPGGPTGPILFPRCQGKGNSDLIIKWWNGYKTRFDITNPTPHRWPHIHWWTRN